MPNLKKFKKNVVLAPYTTFKIGGPAKYFFVAKNQNDFIEAVKISRQENLKLFILGLGSNVLISDKGFDGLVIKNELFGLEFDKNRVKAEAGIANGKLLNECALRGLSGLEILAGVPGTLGGSVYGNAGTKTRGIGYYIREVKVIDQESKLKTITQDQCHFKYRYSIFKKTGDIILSARLKLEETEPQKARDLIKESLLKRKEAQPIGLRCAGSIFKNTPKRKAWKIIDSVGLRGKRIGEAMVSEKHTNFIINTGHATAEQMVILISYIKQQVRDKLGIQLEEEIRYIGF